MKYGVETIVNKSSCTVEIKIQQVDENSHIKEYHSTEYDMTFWNTREKAEANLRQVKEAWEDSNYTVVRKG